MALHALDAFGDALSATKRYRPHGLFEWLWLAVVAILVGAPTIALPTGGGTGGTADLSPEERAQLEGALPAGIGDLLVGIAVALAVLWLLFALLGALLEFPFLR
jgi:hypothetical protein